MDSAGLHAGSCVSTRILKQQVALPTSSAHWRSRLASVARITRPLPAPAPGWSRPAAASRPRGGLRAARRRRRGYSRRRRRCCRHWCRTPPCAPGRWRWRSSRKSGRSRAWSEKGREGGSERDRENREGEEEGDGEGKGEGGGRKEEGMARWRVSKVEEWDVESSSSRAGSGARARVRARAMTMAFAAVQLLRCEWKRWKRANVEANVEVCVEVYVEANVEANVTQLPLQANVAGRAPRTLSPCAAQGTSHPQA